MWRFFCTHLMGNTLPFGFERRIHKLDSQSLRISSLWSK
ncbi:hypothetical protein GAGA_3472 [Paraglaciecola agarilytica NO2]|uniref:Uncharacterized protein n=1 Tax=Paraglaciecola agarilytica NO2 TaxID=1125747 RepID=A0ABQ0IAC5_9ALTE|nr:hypothetical protein GAGA_3472 [Paraglaciecola agarilytica NO2]